MKLHANQIKEDHNCNVEIAASIVQKSKRNQLNRVLYGQDSVLNYFLHNIFGHPNSYMPRVLEIANFNTSEYVIHAYIFNHFRTK